MIPPKFDYVRATSVDEAISALGQHGDEAKILAGGHSLLPLLRLRLAMPGVLIDLGGIDELRGVREEGDRLVIGAMTTHHAVVKDPLVREHCGVLAEATATIGDPQVRHRGTIGGALAHADPAGDLPAVAVALDAELVARGPSGERTIPAAEFFVDYLENALADDEILTAISFPTLSGWGFNYQKFNRVAQAWAIVGACAAVRRDNGTITEARVGLTHMGTTPVRATAVEQALAGEAAEPSVLAQAADQAAQGTSPPTDLNAEPDFRQHLARVLTRRALEQAIGA